MVYCSAGNNWFVIEKTDTWKVFRCYGFFKKNIEIYSLNNDFKLCDDSSCKYNCKLNCDLAYTKKTKEKTNYNNSNIRISFHPVITCFNDCIYCGIQYVKDLQKEIISIDLTQKLFKNFNSNFPNSNLIVEISGGEPLIHPKLEEIINIISKYSKKILLFTSLYNINNLKNILDTNIEFIISCHPTGKRFNMHEFINGIDLIFNSKNKFSVHIIDHLINKDFIPIYTKLLEKYINLKIWPNTVNINKTNKIYELMNCTNYTFNKI